MFENALSSRTIAASEEKEVIATDNLNPKSYNPIIVPNIKQRASGETRCKLLACPQFLQTRAVTSEFEEDRETFFMKVLDDENEEWGDRDDDQLPPVRLTMPRCTLRIRAAR